MADDHGRIWVVKDHWSRDIVLYENAWHNHILCHHDLLRGHESAVADVLMHPKSVMRDAYHQDRECFYARTLPGQKSVYIKVVVEFQPDQEGVVVTAYPTPIVRDDEVKKWP